VRSLLPQITGPYVLYPTGSHPRKNNERLVEAFAAIPHQDRREWRLVLGGDLPSSTSHHLHHLAARLGIQGSLVTTGFVEDELLVALYQAAALVCFPSLAEGFGLPVAEALACGVPVIAADRPPLDDLIPAHQRFDPDDTAAIATALVTAMRTSASTAATGAGRSLDGAAALTRPSTWTEVANRSGQAFDAMLEATDVIRLRPSAPRRTISRRRIAFVTPLPPAATGIAHYSYRLAEELLATGRIDLDLFSDGPTPHQQAPLGASLYAARSLIAVEEVVGGYDDVVYAFGNSHHHLGAIAMLRQRSGTVIAHDVRLTNLYRHESGDPGLVPGGLGRKVHELYADTLPESIGVDGSIRPEDEDRFGVLMAREVVKLSTRYLVSSQAARTLAALDASIDTNLAVLDFAMESPVVGALPLRGPTKSTEPIVATFGIVDPVKEPDLLLTAFTRIRSALVVAGLDSPKLVFVGPVSDALHQHLVRRADELDLTSNVILTGSVSSTEYRRWLAQATVAVQLRRRTQGEASAAIGECLASGLPTIVTDIGWSGELPDSAVVKVPRSVPAHELADVVTALVLDSGARSSLSRAGLEIAAERTFTRTASRLLEILDD